MKNINLNFLKKWNHFITLMMFIIVHIYMFIILMDMKVTIIIIITIFILLLSYVIIIIMLLLLAPLMFRIMKNARINISKGLDYIYSFFGKETTTKCLIKNDKNTTERNKLNDIV